MKIFLTALALLALTPRLPAQAVEQAARDLAGVVNRVTTLEDRVAALEARAGLQNAVPGKRTYEEAYRRAEAEGKPLVVWNGAAVCPPCVQSTEGEFVSFVGTVPGLPADTVTVHVADAGGMAWVGTVSSWVTGDATYGHVPSIRRALRRWREARQATVQDWGRANTSYPAYADYPAGFGQPFQPAAFAGGGGCAACGTSGGLFRRR